MHHILSLHIFWQIQQEKQGLSFVFAACSLLSLASCWYLQPVSSRLVFHLFSVHFPVKNWEWTVPNNSTCIICSISPSRSRGESCYYFLSQPQYIHTADIWQKIQKYPLPYHQTMEQLLSSGCEIPQLLTKIVSSSSSSSSFVIVINKIFPCCSVNHIA